MSHSLRAGVGALAAAVIAAATLVLAAPAGAAPAVYDLYFNPATSTIQAGGLAVIATIDTPCDTAPTASDVTFSFNGTPVADITATILSNQTFSFTVPQGLRTVPGDAGLTDQLEVTIQCTIGTDPGIASNQLSWGQIDITKVVVGDAPAGAEFVIDAVCTADPVAAVGSIAPATLPEPVELSFSMVGGETSSIFLMFAGMCEIAETQNAGAVSSVVSMTTVVADMPTLIPVTVTNTFEVKPAFTG